MPATPVDRVSRLFICDSEDDRPTSNLQEGDRSFCVTTGREFIATGASTWYEAGVVPSGAVIAWPDSEDVPAGWSEFDDSVPGQPHLLYIRKD